MSDDAYGAIVAKRRPARRLAVPGYENDASSIRCWRKASLLADVQGGRYDI